MRPHRWLLAVLALALFAAAAPAAAQSRPPKNNVVVADVESAGYPADLLSEEEVAKIERLQNGLRFFRIASPVSPDDAAVLVSGPQDLGFLSLADGSVTQLNTDNFGPLIPLPLVGATSFRWIDERTLAGLGVNFAASGPQDLYVVILIDRITLEISAFAVPIPAGTNILSVSPDFEKYLLVELPEEPGDEGEGGDPGQGRAIREARLQVSLPMPPLGQRMELEAPARLQRQIDRMLRQKPGLLDGVQFMRQEDESAQEMTAQTLDLLRYNAASGEIGYVTTLPSATSLFGEAWNNDSSRLALSVISFSDPDEARDTYDGALISETFYRDATGNLRPADNPLLQGNNTYFIDFGSGETKILRPSGGEAPPLYEAYAWSPDNATLLVQAYYPARLEGRTHPIYFPQFFERGSFRFFNTALVETGRFEPGLLSAPGNIPPRAIFLSPDELLLLGLDGTDRQPYYYNRASGELRNIADRAGTYFDITPLNRSRGIIFGHTSFTSPHEFYRSGWDGKALSRLTWNNEELRLEANLAEYPVSFRLRNGQTRAGVLIQPAGEPFPPRNRPLVVWQEGGPGVPMNGAWLSNVENPYNLLPAFGFNMLVVPLAGRPGYTPKVFNSLAERANFGAIDIDELAEITGQAVSRGWTSRGRVGITGCSYGGYFAWQSIIRHPDLYAAANPQCALVDTISEWTRGFPILMPYLEGVPPYVNPEEYRRDSPAYNAGRVRTPVLTFHGSQDFLPVVQNENLHLQLFNRGVPARMVKFIGEGHGLGQAQNQLYAAQEQIVWFRTYLK